MSFFICRFSARICEEYGPKPGELQIMVRFLTPRSRKANNNSCGQPCSTPKPPRRILAPSGISATAAAAVKRGLRMLCGLCQLGFARMAGQVFTYLQVHPIDFCEKPRYRQAIVGGIGFNPAQMCHLLLKTGNPL